MQFLEDMGHCPVGCNGIIRLDTEIEFCKLNCQWAKVPQGRPKKNECEKKKRERKSKSGIKNPKSICLVLEKDHLDFIKSCALHKSVEEGKIIEVNELIRQALAKAFPAPTQFDMFGEKK